MNQGAMIAYSYVGLILLLAITVALSFVNLGIFNFGVALLIACMKAALILLFFMEIRRSIPAVKVMVVSILIWGVIFAGLSFADYLTRGWPLNPVIKEGLPVDSHLRPLSVPLPPPTEER